MEPREDSKPLSSHCLRPGEAGEVTTRRVVGLETLLQSFLELQQGAEKKKNDSHEPLEGFRSDWLRAADWRKLWGWDEANGSDLC